MIGREMFSFAEKKGDNINFVVLYGYEFLSKGYKIFVSEKHTGKSPRFSNELNNILNKYGKYHDKRGKVTKYVLNFYYPHDTKHDIWDLLK
jgi:FPC/CPF motif-containing protein YcgG